MTEFLDHAEILALIERTIEGGFTSMDNERLNELLEFNPTAREAYLTYVGLHCDLTWQSVGRTRQALIDRLLQQRSSDAKAHNSLFQPNGEEQVVAFKFNLPSQSKETELHCSLGDRPRSSGHSTRTPAARSQIGLGLRSLVSRVTLTALALVGSIWAIAAYLLFFSSGEYRQLQPDQDIIPVATLSGERECVWQREGGQPLPRIGQQFSPGNVLVLGSGTARLTFADGAVVHLEGPSRFVVRSAKEGVIKNGKALVQVPRRAIGFCISAPNLEVVDLGTEFGVQANAAGATEVQVFRGLTEVIPSSKAEAELALAKPLRLTEGQAVAGDAEGVGEIAKAGNLADFLVPVPRSDSSEAEDGRIHVDFSKDPGWIGANNRKNGNDYGYRPASKVAGGAAGEAGGTFARIKSKDSYYADTHLARELTLDNKFTASGKFGFSDIVEWGKTGDSGMFIGYFSTSDAPNRQEFVGLRLKEDWEDGQLFVRPLLTYWLPEGNGPDVLLTHISIYDTFTFHFTYDPDPDLTLYPGSDGRLTLTVTGPKGYKATASIDDIGRGSRMCGARFDAFGLGVSGVFNSEDDPEKHVDVFLDDVRYDGFVEPQILSGTDRIHSGVSTNFMRSRFGVLGRSHLAPIASSVPSFDAIKLNVSLSASN